MVQALAQLATATGSRRLGVLVKRKQLVKRKGEWVEEYVDKGPAQPALRGFSSLIHTHGQRFPTGRKAPKYTQ